MFQSEGPPSYSILGQNAWSICLPAHLHTMQRQVLFWLYRQLIH